MAKKRPKARMSRDQRNDAHKKKLMSYVLVVLMVVSVAGIFASSTSSNGLDYEYGEYSFELYQEPALNYQTMFKIKKDDSGLYFYGLPQDAMRLSSTGNLSRLLQNSEMFVLSSDNDPYYMSFFDQVRFELELYAKKPSIPATLDVVNGSTLPVFNCANSSLQVPIVELVIGNSTSIDVNDETGCVQISSRVNDLGVVRDRLLFSSLGIIN